MFKLRQCFCFNINQKFAKNVKIFMQYVVSFICFYLFIIYLLFILDAIKKLHTNISHYLRS